MIPRTCDAPISVPASPSAKSAPPQAGTYVVCLDCGKQFDYESARVRIGRPKPVPFDAADDVSLIATPRSKTLRIFMKGDLLLSFLTDEL
jgi:hypothetical protein